MAIIELERDSVCLADDIELHEKTISIPFIIEPIEFISKISEKYLPNINGRNHKWECWLNNKKVGIIMTSGIKPIVSEINYENSNRAYFKYYPAPD